MEYIYGKNTIVSFLGNDQIKEVYMHQSFDDKKIIEQLKNKKVKINYVEKNYLDRLANGGKHQGIVASIEGYKYQDLDNVLNKIKNKKNPFLIMLDGIEDPHNFGAIIRTCEAFSVDGIIVSKHDSCPLNATVAKVSTGAIANVDIIQVTNLTKTLNILKKEGFWVLVAEAYNSVYYETLDYDFPTVLVLGSEGFGVSRLVKEQADYNVAIKQYGKVNSLNVSVASAILISYISLKQKK